MPLIRRYHQDDLPQVISLWADTGLTTASNNPRKGIARKLDVDPHLFLVGSRDGEIVATVMGGYDGHRGWINYLAVQPDLQQQSIGKQMMAAVEALLLQRGCPKINLQIRLGNSTAKEFYQTQGYCEDAVISLGKRLIADD